MQESDYLKAETDVLARLAKLSMFNTLDEAGLRSIAILCKIKRYQPDEVIIQQGVMDQWVFLLLSGEVAVIRDGVEINRLMRSGDVFGEMGVVEALSRSATVKAVSASLCLSLDSSVMDRFDPQHRVIFEAVFYRVAAEHLSARLRKADEELAQRSGRVKALEGKLAELTARLGALEGKPGTL